MNIQTLAHDGFQKGGRAAKGSWPTFLEAAEGRVHYGRGLLFPSFSSAWAIIFHDGSTMLEAYSPLCPESLGLCLNCSANSMSGIDYLETIWEHLGTIMRRSYRF